jgi:thiol-disulfide isomerase/thioredoxin
MLRSFRFIRISLFAKYWRQPTKLPTLQHFTSLKYFAPLQLQGSVTAAMLSRSFSEAKQGEETNNQQPTTNNQQLKDQDFNNQVNGKIFLPFYPLFWEMKLKSLVLLTLILGAFPLSVSAQKREVIKLNQLLTILNNESDSLYVINFWATWCKPCVEEMQEFLRVEQEFENEKVKFIYLSLDFKRDFELKVIPFANKRKMKSDVLLLDEPDYDAWINIVEPSWQGSIPATLLLTPNAENRHFHEGQLTYPELKKIIDKYLL